MNNAAPLNLDILAFNDSYDKAQHIHRAWLSAVWAATTILIAVFAIVTSLQSLRILAALSLILPHSFFYFCPAKYGKDQEIKKPLQTGGGLFVASIAFVIASFSFYGFGLADEKDITELVTPEVSKAAIEASRTKRRTPF